MTNVGSWVKSDINLAGKTAIVTGANSGIGFETALDLARRNARVVLACRNSEKAKDAVEKIQSESGSSSVFAKQLDLASFASVRNFASEIIAEEDCLDILINNAGVMMCPHSKSEDGIELQLATNYLGHFLLTNLLLDLLKRSAPSRIVNVSSSAHQSFMISQIYWDDLQMDEFYSSQLAYSQSKLMLVMFTKELSKKLHGTGVTAYVVHPGAVNTNLHRHIYESGTFYSYFFRLFAFISRPFWKTPKHGAQTSIYCAIAPEVKEHSGSYFVDCQLAERDENPIARMDEENVKLWKFSEEITEIFKNNVLVFHRLVFAIKFAFKSVTIIDWNLQGKRQ